MERWPLVENTSSVASVAVLADAESLALAAAAIIVGEARRAVKNARRFSIALAGGSTPKPVYKLLAEPPFARLMPWEKIEVFWGDERCVEPGDPRSNERMAREALLDHVPVPAGRMHPVRCTGADAGDAAGKPTHGETAARRAAADYDRLLRRLLAGDGCTRAPAAGLDVVLLGMGENGHTASLFPGFDPLGDEDRWVAAALEDPDTATATSGTGERLWRVTLTAPFINRAALVLFVVRGASKAAAVKGALEGEGDPRDLPARAIHPTTGRLCWLLDEGAASQLQTVARPLSGPDDIESFDDLPDCETGPSR